MSCEIAVAISCFFLSMEKGKGVPIFAGSFCHVFGENAKVVVYHAYICRILECFACKFIDANIAIFYAKSMQCMSVDESIFVAFTSSDNTTTMTI